jgi:hypothetical protein
MDAVDIGQEIQDLLEGIENWSGKIHQYIPPVSSEIDVAQALTTDPIERTKVDVWFINRVRIRTLKYGEAPRGSIPVGFRQRTHLFQIRGFQSVRTTTTSGDPSEVEFQALCDKIEGVLAKSVSLGMTAPSLYFGGLEMDIGYDMIGKVLCHVMTARVMVTETIQTSYTV